MGLFDALQFDLFAGKDALTQGLKKPDQLLLGAADPFSAKVWGGITGRDYEPLVNQFGGPSDGAYDRAQARGMDTGTAKTAHGIAQTIAGLWGGAGAMGALSGAGGAAGAAGSGLQAGGGLGLNPSTAAAAPGMGGQGILAQPSTFMANAPTSSAAAGSGGLMSQASPYLQGANNVLRSAGMAQQLANGQQQPQAPAVDLGGGQRVMLGQNGLTANQRRQRGLLG